MLAALLVASAAHANPLVERLVNQLEASPSGCARVATSHPQRRLIESDIAKFSKLTTIPEGVRFEVLDCPVDGFVYRGQTVVISTRLSRMSAPQRFFIIAHEMGHLKLQHHAAIMSFVSRAVDTSADESAARAQIASGLAAISHQAELDADAFAVRLMREARLDPEQAARIFDTIGDGEDNGTHPSPGRRARAIRAMN
ncbi:MAG: M48 family metalloprotease [Burkholderiales bacterium]|jgi:Zn-dependent protease with chaperone function|nr:M48 family metalloprotease [Burkholderiales bacterium]